MRFFQRLKSAKNRRSRAPPPPVARAARSPQPDGARSGSHRRHRLCRSDRQRPDGGRHAGLRRHGRALSRQRRQHVQLGHRHAAGLDDHECLGRVSFRQHQRGRYHCRPTRSRPTTTSCGSCPWSVSHRRPPLSSRSPPPMSAGTTVQTVDTFDTTEQIVTANSGTPTASSSVAATEAIGGERDVLVTYTVRHGRCRPCRSTVSDRTYSRSCPG